MEKMAVAIRQSGPLPFARFMELALYCPVYGYYEQEANSVGRAGDYMTSVSVGPLFGQLLAFQFAEWLAPAKRRDEKQDFSPVQLVEAGAHDGRLAADILGWLRQHRPQLFARLNYRILEPSSRRQAWQKRTLADFAGHVTWEADFETLRRAKTPRAGRQATNHPEQPAACVIFSNELMDALPVRRIGWDAHARVWFEWGVGLEDGRLAWQRMSPEQTAPAELAGLLQQGGVELSNEFLDVLPDGFTTEVGPAAVAWWREAAGCLQHGRLMALDYGLSAGEFFAPHRKDGTLRAYHRHRFSTDLLANPGQQDLTAHVNFTALQSAGEAAGLRTETYTSQADFLVGLLQRAASEPEAFDGWDAQALRQFKTLTHPEHLGRAFRVLVQTRAS